MKNANHFATRFAAPLLAVLLAAAPGLSLHAQQYGPPQGPPPGQGGYGQGGHDRDGDRGWDAPPNEFSDVGRRGFHDGIEAARSDFSQHRPLAFQRNPQFRHPPAPGPLRNDYRNGFQRGYERAADRMTHQGPPPQGGGYPR